MFRPFRILSFLLCIYLSVPALGFGLFPDYFDFDANQENFLVLGLYSAVLLGASFAGSALEQSGRPGDAVISRRSPLHQPWPSRSSERRALSLLLWSALVILALGLIIVISSSLLNSEFSPHLFRLSVASSGNLLLILSYNAFALLTLIATNLALMSLRKARKRMPFASILAMLLFMVWATGQRSMIMLVLLSYLFLISHDPRRKFSKLKAALAIIMGLVITIALGVVRQGDSFSIPSLVWQLSARFDLFYPQFFNFLSVYNGLPDIGYGYHHFTFPLQVVPSSFLEDKPLTFLHFVNRDLMGIPDSTGNDFSAYAEFIYSYGVIFGALLFAIHCFVAAFLVQRVYRNALQNPTYFALYFPCILVYVTLVLLTGISNQQHFFAAAGILSGAWFCRGFIRYAMRPLGRRRMSKPYTQGRDASYV